MKPPAVFCEAGMELIVEHIKQCETCRLSIKTAIDQLPFIGMFTDVKRLKETIDNLKGGNTR